MTRYLLVITLLSLGLRASAQKQFVLTGTITGAPENAYVKINYPDHNDKTITDSVPLVNDSFSIKGNIAGATRAFVGIKTKSVEIYLEPKAVTLTGSFANLANASISGSKTNDDFIALKAQQDFVTRDFKLVVKKINDAGKELEQAKKDNKSERVIDSLNDRLMAAKKERDPFVAKFEAVVRDFVTTHPASVISAVQMHVYTHDWALNTVKTIYNGFTNEVKNSNAGKKIAQVITDREKAVGQQAKDFSGIDLNGKPLKLTDFKGKYVLLDFWGSWCVPCRAEMPHALEIFKKYNKLGLEVIAIAGDEKKDDWIRAIKKDGTSVWHNIMLTAEESQMQNKVVKQYNIHVFPTKILIDKEGKVIAAYEGGGSEELDKKLAEVFKAG